jgi:hypothetical protein
MKEHASNFSSISTMVLSARHAAHPKQATFEMGSEPLRKPRDTGTDIQNRDRMD